MLSIGSLIVFCRVITSNSTEYKNYKHAIANKAVYKEANNLFFVLLLHQ